MVDGDEFGEFWKKIEYSTGSVFILKRGASKDIHSLYLIKAAFSI